MTSHRRPSEIGGGLTGTSFAFAPFLSATALLFELLSACASPLLIVLTEVEVLLASCALRSLLPQRGSNQTRSAQASQRTERCRVPSTPP